MVTNNLETSDYRHRTVGLLGFKNRSQHSQFIYGSFEFDADRRASAQWAEAKAQMCGFYGEPCFVGAYLRLDS